MILTDSEFENIKNIIYRQTGICLGEKKKALVISRLVGFLSKKGFKSFSEYLESIMADSSGQGISDLVNRISTNHTFFFREKEHFDFLRDGVLPELVAERRKKNRHDLRLWSAACATGEEPYSLVILLKEFFGREYAVWNAGVLATDISLHALNRARAGIYQAERMSLIPPGLKEKYFKPLSDDHWEIIDKVKSEVTFRRFNLLNDSYPFKQRFDVIFCRNVMIYFSVEDRMRLVNQLCEWLSPGGYFFVGHSETIRGYQRSLEYVRPGVFQKGEDS